MRVAVVTVGDELLSGYTNNTNATWLAERLTERGVTIERIVTIPDRSTEVAQVVNEYRAKFDAVIVTGGIGPTHDDVTMEGVAAALGRCIDEHPDAVTWFEAHETYSHDELVNGTTHLPAGARMLPNDEGVAPGAVLTGEDGVSVYVLPGVPVEMRAMFEHVADEFDGIVQERAVVETDEPESALIGQLNELLERFDVSVGSYPGDSVRVTIEGEADEVEAAATWLSEMLPD